MRLMTLLFCTAAALAACAPAAPTAPGGTSTRGPHFIASNGRVVYRLETPGQFEVLADPGDAGTEFFCAAGDFANREGANPTERVALVAPVGDSPSQPGRRGAVFAIRPPGTGLPDQGNSINTRRVGQSYTVGTARQFCRIRPVVPF